MSEVPLYTEKRYCRERGFRVSGIGFEVSGAKNTGGGDVVCRVEGHRGSTWQAQDFGFWVDALHSEAML